MLVCHCHPINDHDRSPSVSGSLLFVNPRPSMNFPTHPIQLSIVRVMSAVQHVHTTKQQAKPHTKSCDNNMWVPSDVVFVCGSLVTYMRIASIVRISSY
jgi:hypothetical protein